MAQANFTVSNINANIAPPNIDIGLLKRILKTKPTNFVVNNNSFNNGFVVGRDNTDNKFIQPLTHTNIDRFDPYQHFARNNAEEEGTGANRQRNNFVRPIGSSLIITDKGELKIKRNDNRIIVVKEEEKVKHLVAYLVFLNNQKQTIRGQENQLSKFIMVMMTLTLVSILKKRIGPTNNTIPKLSDLLTHIIEYNKKLYDTQKIEDNFKFYDLYVTKHIQIFTSEILNKLILIIDNPNTEDIRILSNLYIKLLKYNNVSTDERIISKEKLIKCISSLKQKLTTLFANKTDTELNSIIRRYNEFNRNEQTSLKKLKHLGNSNQSERDRFRKVYTTFLRTGPSYNKSAFITKLSNSKISEIISNKYFNKKNYPTFEKVAKEVKKEIMDGIIDTEISKIKTSQDEKQKRKFIEDARKTIIRMSQVEPVFSSYLSSFEKRLNVSTRNTKLPNRIKNLQNLKNQYIKNIEQNGVNSIPNNDTLKKEFEEKPAFLREILRKKRSRGSSVVSKIYNDEINYFKKTGKYRPIKAYENNVLISLKNIKGKKKSIEKEINKLGKQKNNIESNIKPNNNLQTIRTKSKSIKNEKNRINKEISNKKNEIKKINDKISNKENEIKSGLMNKSKNINIDREVDSIRKKYQRELLILGRKHLQDLWKSYFNSLTKKNIKYENSKINVSYQRNKKELQKGFGNGFINKYSSPVYKALQRDKKRVEDAMKKLRFAISKSKSPKRRIKLVRKK